MTLAEKIFSLRVTKLAWYKLRRFFSSRKPQVPTSTGEFRFIIWGKHKPTSPYQIPRTIWSYWSGEKSPCAEACRSTWNLNKSDFAVHILTAQTVRDFLPNFPDLPHDIPEQKKSNLIRLMLLERHGGIWIDYSTVITQPLNWVVKLLEENDCEALAFYNEFHDEYRVDHKHPIIENGFLAATPGSKFITDWRTTYQECIQSEDYKKFFRTRDDFVQLTSNFLNKEKDYIDYFVCYIAAQHVMLKSDLYRLFLINAEDEYYYLAYALNPPRAKRKFSEEMLLRAYGKSSLSRLVKVTGRHRIAIDEHIKYGCYHNSSIIGGQLNHQMKQLDVFKQDSQRQSGEI